MTTAETTSEMTTYIENRTFEEIQVGDTASISRTLSDKDIDLFAVMSGDVNPAHVDEEFARSDMFREVIAHGMWGGSLISAVLGTKLPGPGAIYLSQTLRFRRPVKLGDTVTVMVKVTEKNDEKRRVSLECSCINQNEETVISGTAEVIAPTEKIKRPRVVLPEIYLVDQEEQLKRFMVLAEGLAPVQTAVVHPTDTPSLMAAIDAAQANLIVPVLVGPEDKIRAVAEEEGIDLTPYRIVPAEHSHHAAEVAVGMARAGEVETIMKGKLHTQELMHAAVARGGGIRTERRMSHVFVMAIPSYPRPLFITDTALNIRPDLAAKRDIIQNAIHLAQVVGIEQPRVAVLAAVETINPHMPATLDAAALSMMAQRGQIEGGLVDGPLGFDNAISEKAARIKGITSPVAGQADILVVPDLEAGTMLARQLDYLAGAQGAGIVLGAQVPIILTSRADPVLTRLASCALAVAVAHGKQRKRG